MAAHASQQGRRLLGCADHLPDVYGGDAGSSRATARVAGSRRRARPPHARRAGDVVVAGDGYAVGGSRVWHRELRVGNFERDPNPTRDLIRVAEQCASGCAANGSIPGLVYRSQDFSIWRTESYQWKGSSPRVTGSHSLKIGYQHALMYDNRTWFTNNQNLTYRLNNGVPNQLTQSISPWVTRSRLSQDVLFAQDQWTRGRLTLQGAVRFDRARSWFPDNKRGRRGFCQRRSSFRKHGVSTATRTSRRAWVPPTTSSAPAGRHSS